MLLQLINDKDASGLSLESFNTFLKHNHMNESFLSNLNVWCNINEYDCDALFEDLKTGKNIKFKFIYIFN